MENIIETVLSVSRFVMINRNCLSDTMIRNRWPLHIIHQVATTLYLLFFMNASDGNWTYTGIAWEGQMDFILFQSNA